MSEPDPQYEQILDELLAHPTDEAIAERLHARYLQLQRGGTTPGGLPWPSPTDQLSEGADAIRALAEAITPARIGAAPAVHGHSLTDANITGTLPVNQGGTGSTTAAAARTALGITPANIGAATSGHGHSLTDANITGTLPVNQGGTGSTTAAAARAALGAAAESHGHALTDSNITGTLPLNQGGTGSTTAAAARTALGAAAESHGHSLTDANITGTLGVGQGGTGSTSAGAARTALGITPANIGAATSGHGHSLNDSNITGTLPVNQGGTGSTTAAAARTALGAAAEGHGHSLNDSNITGTLPVGQGGTGATSAAAARTALGVTLSNLGAAPASHTHPHTQITGLALTLPTVMAGGFTASVWNRNLTGNRRTAWITDAGGAPTELGHTASSLRYKQDITDLEVTDEQLLQLRLIAFRYKEQVQLHGDDAPWDFGSIAEWFAEHIPWAVFHNDDGTVEGIHYERAWFALLQPVQRLIQDRDQLRERLDALDSRVAALEGRDDG